MDEQQFESDSTQGPLGLHTMYVSNIKEAANQLLKQKGIPVEKAPIALGLKPLDMAVPPMFEAALGYRGQLRYVAFHYSPTQAIPVHSDGGDDLPIPNANDWATFVSHPAVCPQLEQYSTLLGRLSTRPLLTREEFQDLEDDERLGYCSRFHALVLDRQERIFYVAAWQSLKMFQPYSEPDGDEVHVLLDDGHLVSPGNEDYPRPPSQAVVDELFAWLDNHVSDLAAQENLARWHIHHGRPDEGATVLRTILDKCPDRRSSPDFLYELAFLFRKTHDHEAAVDALERYSRGTRVPAQDRFVLSELYCETKQYDKALKQFELAEGSYGPKGAEWYALKARALAGRGEYARAEKICRTAISNSALDEDIFSTAEIHLQLAEIAALQQQYANAALECHAALDEEYVDPESEMEESVAVYRPAWWLSTEARLMNAARNFEKAAEGTSNDGAYAAFGFLYLAMGRYDDAKDSFRRALASDGSPELLWFYGISSLAAKEKGRAEDVFQDLTNRFPQDERGWVGLALCETASGSIDQAFRYCDRASKVNERGGELHAVLAFLHWSQGSYVDAAREARLAAAAGFHIHHVLTLPPDEQSKSLRYLTLTTEQDELKKLALT